MTMARTNKKSAKHSDATSLEEDSGKSQVMLSSSPPPMSKPLKKGENGIVRSSSTTSTVSLSGSFHSPSSEMTTMTTTAATPPPRQVTFSKQSELYFVLSLDDYSPTEVRASWYFPDDFQAMRERNDKIVRRMERGKPPSRDGDCYRGLESATKEGRRVYFRNLTQAIDAVLDEQDAQWREEEEEMEAKLHRKRSVRSSTNGGIMRRVSSIMASPEEKQELLASLYAGACSKCKMVALTIGLQDEREARGDDERPTFKCKPKKPQKKKKKSDKNKAKSLDPVREDSETTESTMDTLDSLSPATACSTTSMTSDDLPVLPALIPKREGFKINPPKEDPPGKIQRSVSIVSSPFLYHEPKR